MIAALVTGALFKAPESRMSKSGKPFATATLRVKDGDTSQYWKILAFSDHAREELLRLHDGDALAVQGQGKFEIYQPDGGAAKLSLTVFADHVLALRQPPKVRQAKGAAGPDDDIPFGVPR
jgi:single-stranded DNA-binding protein